MTTTRKPPAKGGKFSKSLIVAIITMNILFTIAVFWAFVKTSVEPSTLIVSWFAWTGTELLAMAGIKITEK